jgi:hypothetical protein
MLADPAIWTDRCALAGVALSATRDGLLQEYGDFTDRKQAPFLAGWLNLTPGGTNDAPSGGAVTFPSPGSPHSRGRFETCTFGHFPKHL